MKIKKIEDQSMRAKFDSLARHPLQSWVWGDFREKTGVRVLRWGVFDRDGLVEPIQVTIHPLSKLPWSVGYLPRGYFPNRLQVKVLRKIALKYNCLFIKVEPMVERLKVSDEMRRELKENGLVLGRPLFTKYNFVLDLDQDEDELLANMKSKTRYNVRLAKRRGVRVKIDNSDEAFEEYIKLTKETTKRQKFYAHSEDYQRKMWEVMRKERIANLMVARFRGKALVAWILFKHGETMYYPYGASSRERQNFMASNLVMWEAIKYAKREGCKKFDMWGALGLNPDKKDPWYGFHRFKAGYGARHVEYVGTYDYVARAGLYRVFRVIDALRWMVLRKL